MESKIHCISIIGQVEGHYELPSSTKSTKYELLLPQLAAIEESDEIEGLLILLNTVGGDIEAGLAIAELIAGMKKPTVSLILGGGNSTGVPLAVSAKRCFIAPTASMTLHPVRMSGTVLGVPQTVRCFEQIQERIIGFVSKNSNASPDTVRNLMMNTGELMGDTGSVICGEEAVRLGLCDGVGSLKEALSCLHEMMEKTASFDRKEQ